MSRIISGDDVIILTGKDKGKIGKVIKVIKKKCIAGQKRCFLIVSGVNICKKSTKATQNKKGGIVNIEKMIDISNVAFFDSETGIQTKIGYKFIDNKKVRIAKCSGKVIS
ncbi:50S ribosomal protein L24 [Candidatus Neoehrlichia procyonis]|uniref:Large ribosomal subunit protein uL24 n=1 Tax=Candidatus Neoehrlichia procyonis str. RAC413 TaxID=1359163 RepID=A0A0F3NLY2_9RICK|nr:50S ribosomal protein L24 [Candidatus Neoehrlichia lotoris]KJV69053.1 ribosomal protein L24 [Candidatus Neoehrlichia lotoris str. RAC413]